MLQLIKRGMIMETENPDVKLIEPDVERDAPLSMQWLDGELGRQTLSLMGVPDKENKPTTLELEKQRVEKFLEDDTELNLMIEFQGKVVGSVWAHLTPSEHLEAPSVHIMIGDPSVRGRGVGSAAMNKLIETLTEQGNKTIYSRHLVSNVGPKVLLESLGFKVDGPTYSENDLEWQNVILRTSLLVSFNSRNVNH